MGFGTQTTPLLLPLVLMLVISPSSRSDSLAPRLGVFDPDGEHPNQKENASADFETFSYKQALDHFNYNPESYSVFNQKYMINSKYWGGARHMAPIFVYLGAEAPLTTGHLLADLAQEFRALLLFIEHRFYGESVPFGMKMEQVVANATVRGYFNSAQALADYAEVILDVKKKLHAPHSPVVVFGGSYGGMLASWFRLKYPHVALGALASSAPILYFDQITPQDAYYLVVTKDFRETSETCYKTIRDSWAEINKVANKTNGLSYLTKKFKTCSELSDVWELKNFLMGKYAAAAQYGRPPVYKATAICNAIDDGAHTSDILDRIFSGVVAYYGAEKACYNTTQSSFDSQTSLGWAWQSCSDMVMPIGIGPKNPMFETQPYSWTQSMAYCKSQYGVLPRPHWITTYFGGQDIKLILERFGSNIIFSNGLRDPYSSAGVLEDISKTVVAIKTKKGSHCMDILPANASTDPKWLVHQRKEEVKVLKGWIHKYYADLTKS